MSRKLNSLSKQLMVAAALALGTSGAALADDSSMSRIGGDSYKYFSEQSTRSPAAAPSWRQSHPNGLSEAELQALSASGSSTFWAQLNPPVFAGGAADPTWRQTHPNGMTEREMEAYSASALAVWQLPDRSQRAMSASIDGPRVAQASGKETLTTRLAKIFRRDNGAQADSYQ